MQLIHLDSKTAVPVTRPGCTGMRMIAMAQGATYDATALYFDAHASSDDHAAPFDEWFVVTEGQGRVSIGEETSAVREGDMVSVPRNVFHRYWTEDEAMGALALTFAAVPGPGLVRVPDLATLSRNAAERFVLLARQAIAARGRFSIALSGGATPRPLYTLLASPGFAPRVDWTRVYVFWGDERAVPPDDPASNFRMANETLLSQVPIPVQNIHRISAEKGAPEAAQEYEKTLRDWFQPAVDAVPQFDLVLLGLGENGHTASLFPHTAVLHQVERWVAGYHVAETNMDRITLTVPVINAALNILFLVAGPDKAPTVRAVLRGDYRPDDLPAQLIQPAAGHVVWLLDKSAAQDL